MTTYRYVVEIELHIAGEVSTVEATLVSRKRMIGRMLLGRTALGPTFLVDSSRRFILSKPPARKKPKPIGKANKAAKSSKTEQPRR
ncbi:MAG: RimK/LysX family protein [Planctomycetota bacterium]